MTGIEGPGVEGGGGTPVVPGGASGDVQFNDGGAFGGDDHFTYDPSTTTIQVGSGVTDGGQLRAPNATGSGVTGVNLMLTAGDGGGGTSDGGSVEIMPGNATGSGSPGVVDVSFSDSAFEINQDGVQFHTSRPVFASLSLGSGSSNANASIGVDIQNDVADELQLVATSSTASGAQVTNGPSGPQAVLTWGSSTPFTIATNSAASIIMDSVGNVVTCPAARIPGSRDGFLYLPKVGGAPLSAPNNLTGVYQNTVPCEIDVVNGRLYAYYGGAWHFAAFT